VHRSQGQSQQVSQQTLEKTQASARPDLQDPEVNRLDQRTVKWLVHEPVFPAGAAQSELIYNLNLNHGQ
jgi:hypothetical protein